MTRRYAFCSRMHISHLRHVAVPAVVAWPPISELGRSHIARVRQLECARCAVCTSKLVPLYSLRQGTCLERTEQFQLFFAIADAGGHKAMIRSSAAGPRV